MSFQFTAEELSVAEFPAGGVPAGGFQEMAGVGDGYTDDADYRAMGIEANRPTEAKPGSEDKVLILAARYAAGLPLWHTDDCCDHAPDRFAGLLAGFGAG